jgi:DNA-binding MarR family transcriptional regulator
VCKDRRVSEVAVQPRVSYVIARVERAVRAAIAARVRPFGLTWQQYTTMSILGHKGGLSNAQLARRAYMTPQSMSEVIEALEAKGLVVRTPHPSHRRVLPASLTPRGRKVLTACDAAVDEMEEQMLRELDESDRERLRACLVAAARALGAGFPR